MKLFDYQLVNSNLSLPSAHLLPKFHKEPIQFRTIIASCACVTKLLAKHVGLMLSKILRKKRADCKYIASYCGFNPFWIIDDNRPIIDCLKKCNKIRFVKSIETYDFTTLYTTLDHDLIKTNLELCIRSTMKDKRLVIGGSKCFWSDNSGFSANDVINRVNFLIDNCYFSFGNLTLKQCIGIPMGLDSAPQIANLLLHQIEYNYFMGCLKQKQFEICKKLSHVYRYIDDITIVNGSGLLDEIVGELYPSSLKLEKINSLPNGADVLDLHIWIDPYTKVFHIQTFDKRRQFRFEVTSMPFLHSNVSLSMCHNAVISQFVRHAKLNDFFEDFILNLKILFKTLKNRGYRRSLLLHLLRKADSRHRIFQKYHKTFCCDFC
jgi:hypothetical protein